ncbi:hypothetical protein JQK62_20850, partial [Leptospira santarosai]|nr:hypothetical protein [Leptospira santarosai]
AAGFGILNYDGFLKILQALLISPFLALAVGFLMMSLFKILFKKNTLYKTNKGFRIFQIGTAALQSFTHGTNDAQKAIQKNRFVQIKTIAETLVDPETGEILAEQGAVIDRRLLDRLIPHLENGIGFQTISQVGGVFR